MKLFLTILLTILIHISLFSQTNAKNSNQKISTAKDSDLAFPCDNEIEAHFPGGKKAWMKFVSKNVRITEPMKKALKGTYKVIITFLITKEGKISKVKAHTNFGYEIEEEVIRVIKQSPKWVPATNCGMRISYWEQQPVIIII